MAAWQPAQWTQFTSENFLSGSRVLTAIAADEIGMSIAKKPVLRKLQHSRPAAAVTVFAARLNEWVRRAFEIFIENSLVVGDLGPTMQAVGFS